MTALAGRCRSLAPSPAASSPWYRRKTLQRDHRDLERSLASHSIVAPQRRPACLLRHTLLTEPTRSYGPDAEALDGAADLRADSSAC